MTSPLAVVTSAISTAIRPRPKLPKQESIKARGFHECIEDTARGMLEQLIKDAECLNERHRTMRFYVIIRAVDERSLRHTVWELKYGCGFHRSEVALDPTIDALIALRAVNEQLQALHECNSRIKPAEAHVQHVYGRNGDEGSEVTVSYLTFTLELKWS